MELFDILLIIILILNLIILTSILNSLKNITRQIDRIGFLHEKIENWLFKLKNCVLSQAGLDDEGA